MLIQRVEKIGLILVVIEAAQQFDHAVAFARAYVMTGGNAPRAKHLCVVEESLELDFTVAHDIGIGRAPDTVFVQKIFEHIVPVLTGKVDCVQPDAKAVANLLGVGEINGGRAIFSGIVFLPILHE